MPPISINLRLPHSLHAHLKQRAAAEGVSLNQLMVFLLTAGLGKDQS